MNERMNIQLNSHSDGQTERKKERQTHRQTSGQIDRQNFWIGKSGIRFNLNYSVINEMKRNK
jgi:hypothetical protein